MTARHENHEPQAHDQSDAVFAELLGSVLRDDVSRRRPHGELTTTIMHRLGYRAARPRWRKSGAMARAGTGAPAARARSARGVGRGAARVGHFAALALVIVAGFMINNTLPSAVRAAPTTVPGAVETGLQRQGERLDGFMRELHRSGPAMFVPARHAKPAAEHDDDGPHRRSPREPAPSGRTAPGGSNSRATAPYRWV